MTLQASAKAVSHANPLRVAHLSPTFFGDQSVIGGGERYVYYLAQALAAASHPEAPFSQSIFSLGRQESSFTYSGIPVQIFMDENPSGHMTHGITGRLWSVLADFDLIHVHQSFTVFGAYSTVVAKSLNKLLVLTDLGSGKNQIMLFGRGVELADGMISISRYAHSLVASTFSGPHEILTGPLDTDLFTPRSARQREKNLAICVSRILPHKGIDRIISALPAGLRLRVVGRVYHEQYFQLLRNMSVGKDVEFIHDADDTKLVELLSSSSLFLQGSTTRDCYGNTYTNAELMGLSTLEALACGVPVIVSDACSLPELVPDPYFGRTFTSQDDLVDLLHAFMVGAWPPQGAGEKARRHVVENYSLPVIGRRLSHFYRSLCEARHHYGGVRACAS
jgi:glycosyltransferase involved in cell wall biosynthesis